MCVPRWFLTASVVLFGGSALGAAEEDRALAALQKAGAIIERDVRRPGQPVVSVDLDFTWAGDKELEALKAFPELRVLKLRECIGITAQGMRCLAGLTQLRELDLDKTRVPNEGLKRLEKLVNLHSLSLFWNTDITDDGLRHLQHLTNLRHLDLNNCCHITDKGVAYLRELTNLRYLGLGGTKISDDGLRCLKSLHNLETLNLHSSGITDKGILHLKDLTHLQSLDLSLTPITDKGLEHLKNLASLRAIDLLAQDIYGDGLEYLKGLPNLRSLRFGCNVAGDALRHLGGMASIRDLSLLRDSWITDKDMKYLQGLNKLRRLELGNLRFITDNGLEPLRQLIDLRSLDLSHLDGITDKSLEHLQGLTNLRELRLSRLENITDVGLLQLRGLLNLRSLELRHLLLTDKGLSTIRGFPQLQSLRIEGIPATDETVRNLGGLSHLRELELPCSNISDAGMVRLKELPNLQTLNVTGTAITNRGLGHLKAMQHLQSINVEDAKVTEEGVENFRESRPGTKIIVFTIQQSGVPPFSERKEPPIAARRLLPLVRVLTESEDIAVQLDVLRGMHEALQGRRHVIAPEGWSAVYAKLAHSKNSEIREKVMQLSVLFGDPQALAALRKTAADPKADATTRRNALQALVENRSPDLLPLLRKLLTDRDVRGAALRGLASYSDPGTPALILDRYASLTDAEKADAVATLASRPAYALALLDAMQNGRVSRRDLSAFHARQLLAFNDKKLTDRLTKVWGTIRPPSRDKAALLAKYKSMVPPDALKNADRRHGRLLFSKNCASCHTLFNDGGKIGPDLTGSQRANPDYLLSKLIDPSAVVARDYQMTVVTTRTGRTISGLVKEETDKTLTMQTQNEVVRLAKSDIEERNRSSQSMMPDGLLTPLSLGEVRDLIAYLAGPGQVPLPPFAADPRK
jgi:putative heme-binding domain-containing protein